ncbi:MAG: hypothetical protein AB1765_11580 [Candidatus Hydrogenedentota bacterium]
MLVPFLASKSYSPPPITAEELADLKKYLKNITNNTDKLSGSISYDGFS